MHPDTTLQAACRLAANVEPRRNDMRPYILLLHYTGMESAGRAADWLCLAESKVSCHYLVDEDGVITQMVPEAMRAWHAGDSWWAGETDINSASIGIEIHNPGHSLGYPDFTEQQMQAVEALSLDIVARHRIRPEHILAHSDVAPWRKRDPGEKFDWAHLAAAGLGHWVEPARTEGDAGFGVGDEGPDVRKLQQGLASYGYRCDLTGVFDTATEFAIIAFQRHFRPALVNGRADHSTLDTLGRLLASRTVPAC
jgi:N-acetylmuramoyl-L-alanine amidase